MSDWLTCADFYGPLVWIDGRPLPTVIEPYRMRFLATFLDSHDADGGLTYNLALNGKAKKNWKTADMILAALKCCVANDSPGGNSCLLFANDEGQANEGLDLLKKLYKVNPLLQQLLTVQEKQLVRKDGQGFIKILPTLFAAGEHGRTYRFTGVDELHAQKSWALLEAIQLDPTRPDAQMWLTSYASLYHKPGVPLHDLMAKGRAGSDPKMLFSWYGADYTTDPDFQDSPPEQRANPSMRSWPHPTKYLAQQAARLPSYAYRQLHLNLPGQPEGSAFTAESVMAAIIRGRKRLVFDPRFTYWCWVDMSGGSLDDAYLAIGHLGADGQLVLDVLMSQGGRPPFNPLDAVKRFAAVAKEFRTDVWMDTYGGHTFQHAFMVEGVMAYLSTVTASQLYQQLEVMLNSGQVELLDDPKLEGQALGLVWRGGKITHPAGEHDDAINAAAGALLLAKESDSSTAELDALMSPEVIAAEMSGRFTETQQLAAEGRRSFRAEDDDEAQFQRQVHFQ